MISKKSQALSMNTIIIAALALLVLAIVSLLFIGRMNVARQDLNACENNGGQCISSNEYNSCNDYLRLDSTSPYSVGRRINQNCFRPDGRVDDTQMCCVFS